MEAIRCLKRYIAHKIYHTIKKQHELMKCSWHLEEHPQITVRLTAVVQEDLPVQQRRDRVRQQQPEEKAHPPRVVSQRQTSATDGQRKSTILQQQKDSINPGLYESSRVHGGRTVSWNLPKKCSKSDLHVDNPADLIRRVRQRPERPEPRHATLLHSHHTELAALRQKPTDEDHKTPARYRSFGLQEIRIRGSAITTCQQKSFQFLSWPWRKSGTISSLSPTLSE